jgi:hypothetical protein
MRQDERESILAEEIIILRHSGEIPEIALHSCLNYLEEDESGPQISLREDELHVLYDAALERAREIVLRDLDPDNRDLSIYRGLARSIVNWYRLQNFCRRINRECHGFAQTVSQALVSFLQQEVQDIEASARVSSVNCSASDLCSFVEELCLDIESLPADWRLLCKE